MRRGFTLLELMVVLVVVGILVAFGLPSYIKSLETTRAEDAASLVSMIATTNRMYALDHNNTYASGELDQSPACGTYTCGGAQGAAHPCNLVACRYLSSQDFSVTPYRFCSANAALSQQCCTIPLATIPAGNYFACAARRGSSLAPYNTWAYAVRSDGSIQTFGSPTAAPAPAQ